MFLPKNAVKKFYLKQPLVKLALLPEVWKQNQRPNPADFIAEDVIYLITGVIQWLLLLAGAVTFIYIIVGGYQYLTSLGNEEAITKAKATLTWAVLGFIVTLAGYTIIKVVAKLILTPGSLGNIFS